MQVKVCLVAQPQRIIQYRRTAAAVVFIGLMLKILQRKALRFTTALSKNKAPRSNAGRFLSFEFALSQSFPVAVLILLTATARAGIIASNLWSGYYRLALYSYFRLGVII